MSVAGTLMRSLGVALSSAFLCGCLGIVPLTPLVLADSGIIPIARTLAYEPGQKAIVAWNGEYEVLILSTDVRADEDTKALQVLPLPSEPESIERGTPSSFRRIGDIIEDHYDRPGSWFDCGPGDEAAGGGGVDIVFHEEIGAHDIWVARATDATGFVRWAEDFLTRNDIQHEISSPELESVIAEYIDEGIQFFVFDLIELTRYQQSVEPIVYRFRSDALYYPLKISSIVSGYTEITLLLLTSGRLADFSQLPRSEFEGHEFGLGVPTYRDEPIQFRLARGDLESIDRRLAALFEGRAWLTVVHSSFGIDRHGHVYHQSAVPVESLTEDLKIAGASFINESFGDEAPGSGMATWAWALVGIGGAVLVFVLGTLLHRRVGSR